MTGCELQSQLQAAVDAFVTAGTETAVQASVRSAGGPDVDVAAGTKPDALFWCASTSKGVAAALVHVLIERGLLSEDLPVPSVWPEFGAHGKGDVTVRHVLTHQAGVPGLPLDWTADDLLDLDRTTAAVATSQPAWRAGTRTGYHALTFGIVLGEVIRRVTGGSASAALREHLTGPLGVVDEVFFGVPEQHLHRVVPQLALDGDQQRLPPGTPGSLEERAVPPGIALGPALANRPDLLGADLLSVGTASARGLATLYAGLLGDRVISRARRERMAAVAVRDRDVVMGIDTELSLGFSPARPAVPSRPGSTFGFVGVNGSVGYADIDSGTAVAVLHNRFRPGDLALARAVDDLVARADRTGGT